MPKKGSGAQIGGRTVATGRDRPRDSNRRSGNGNRAVPGKVPRGSFQLPQGGAFTALGRTILDRLDRGVILLDAKGRIVDANTLAAHVIRTCDGISVNSGRLGFADPALNDRMQQAVARRKLGTTDGRAVVAARIRCRGGEPYSIVVTPVPADADERDVAFFALIYAPNGRLDISSALLREMYGLTRAQADVARSLFATRSVDGTARALDLSLHTVRSHLKQIFTKCEVGSQAELLHLLALGPNRL